MQWISLEPPRFTALQRAGAWAVHLYTATGAVTGFAAVLAIIAGDYRAAFLWMVAATFIDATDGMLARLARVKERAPDFDGARLDDIVDYLTYRVCPGAVALSRRKPAVRVGRRGRGGGPVEQRLRVRVGRREVGRLLFHRISVVLEHRCPLPGRRGACRRP